MSKTTGSLSGVEPSADGGPVVIDARGLHYRLLNDMIRDAVSSGARHIELLNVNGQRYIATGIQGEVTIHVHGVPGNDLAALADGPEVIVHNNAQDAVGNTLNSGRVVVHGDAGDVIGYGMRGGKVFVRGDVGYRVGIHMKSSSRQGPLLVVGGTAADFLGEYQAGGRLVVLGLTDAAGRGTVVGDYCGTGMHGGVIYLRGEPNRDHLATRFVAITPADDKAIADLEPALREFCQLFGHDPATVLNDRFWVVRPFSHRPFAGGYAPNP